MKIVKYAIIPTVSDAVSSKIGILQPLSDQERLLGLYQNNLLLLGDCAKAQVSLGPSSQKAA